MLREEGVVARVDEQRRHADVREPRPARGGAPVVIDIAKAVQRRGDQVSSKLAEACAPRAPAPRRTGRESAPAWRATWASASTGSGAHRASGSGRGRGHCPRPRGRSAPTPPPRAAPVPWRRRRARRATSAWHYHREKYRQRIALAPTFSKSNPLPPCLRNGRRAACGWARPSSRESAAAPRASRRAPPARRSRARSGCRSILRGRETARGAAAPPGRRRNRRR